MPTSTTSDLAELQEIARQHSSGPDSALGLFATTATIPDRDRLAREITDATEDLESHELLYEDPARYDEVIPEQLDALYELETWVADHRYVYGFGHQVTGDSPGEPDFAEDPDEAVTAFVAMVTEFADADDDEAEGDLWIDDYDCHCGHGRSDHDDDGPCDSDCDCSGFEPDFGDDTPNTRATVDAILTDEPPKPGQHYVMALVAGDGLGWTFWLQAIHIKAGS